ncbi:hypothetical protein CDAR_593081 [Caerostris darwini]|uniref:Transposase IS30-like HTH domain-containing protein n=1 Tax=Caerostris darwini TaxID=1538125 RepID=A0AAV4TY65_9ARAC|nr:hypothetical protein CDAR_593081 [Caerostris darwini]
MAPQKSELPISLREKIVSLRENGLSYREIGKKVNVCFSTVRYIIKRHTERGSPSNNLRSGRPKKLSQRIKQKIIREASKNPFVSAITLANDVASTSGVQISAQNYDNGSANFAKPVPATVNGVNEDGTVGQLLRESIRMPADENCQYSYGLSVFTTAHTLSEDRRFVFAAHKWENKMIGSVLLQNSQV